MPFVIMFLWKRNRKKHIHVHKTKQKEQETCFSSYDDESTNLVRSDYNGPVWTAAGRYGLFGLAPGLKMAGHEGRLNDT